MRGGQGGSLGQLPKVVPPWSSAHFSASESFLMMSSCFMSLPFDRLGIISNILRPSPSPGALTRLARLQTRLALALTPLA